MSERDDGEGVAISVVIDDDDGQRTRRRDKHDYNSNHIITGMKAKETPRETRAA